jgi:energy-coupling factor transport system ATP-binding protein
MARAAIGPGAAFAAWLAVLVALNVTADPVLCGAAFAALAVLALRTGHARLLVLSLVVGAGLLLLVPGVALVDGSFAVTFATTPVPSDAVGVLATAAAALRVPAQVLAATWLLLVPGRLLLAGASRMSPDTALLGAITARLRPLLARDARLVRDELASRGLPIDRGAPIGARLRSSVALWEALVSGLLDRSFVTAAALQVRGWGSGRATTDDLTHPELRDDVHRVAHVDRAMLALAGALGGGAIAARALGLLAPPPFGIVPAGPPWTTPAAVVLATCAVALALLPLVRGHATAPQRATHSRAPATPFAPEGARQLEVSGLALTYPGASRPAISDVDLQVRPGELVVLAGPSGGGKSTLLDVVSGIAPATTGGVRRGMVCLGEHVAGAQLRGQGSASVAAVFQHPESQVLVGRVAEEVAFGLRYAGVPVAQVEVRVLEELDRLGIRHLARRDCATLSGGELQRVLLAAALVVDPALLVLDEPTSQVDAATERRFWDAIDRVRAERGIGVLVAEHRLEHLVTRADRIIVVDGGRILRDLDPRAGGPELAALAADPYAGLVPAPVDRSVTRLVVRVDRLDVGGGSGPARTLLRGLSIDVPARSIITLEGPNGTGKSSLLRAIRGLVPGARVLVDGHPITDVARSAGAMAWVSQGAGAVVPGRTVEHAAVETSHRLGRSPDAALAALQAAALGSRAKDHPSELSVGQRQRLAIVAATSHRPPVWLLDEPTRGMDPVSRRWVACHLLAHAAAGGIALVATHDPALAAAIATHRLVLDERTGPSLVPVERDPVGRAILQPAERTAAQPRRPEVSG